MLHCLGQQTCSQTLLLCLLVGFLLPQVSQAHSLGFPQSWWCPALNASCQFDNFAAVPFDVFHESIVMSSTCRFWTGHATLALFLRHGAMECSDTLELFHAVRSFVDLYKRYQLVSSTSMAAASPPLRVLVIDVDAHYVSNADLERAELLLRPWSDSGSAAGPGASEACYVPKHMRGRDQVLNFMRQSTNDGAETHICHSLSTVVMYPPVRTHRSCLLVPPSVEYHRVRTWDLADQQEILQHLTAAANTTLGTYISTGAHTVSALGQIRRWLLDGLSTVDSYSQKEGNREDTVTCDRISAPSADEFVRDYVLRSRPVVIQGAMPGFTTQTLTPGGTTHVAPWSGVSALRRPQYLLEKSRHLTSMHIKAAPRGQFEGVEDVRLWKQRPRATSEHLPSPTRCTSSLDDAGMIVDTCGDARNVPAEDDMPSAVRRQLQSPDKVVVRPAELAMPFDEFWAALSVANDSVSLYMEYTTLQDAWPNLQRDIPAFPHFELAHHLQPGLPMNIWLGGGSVGKGTLGKLHFDPYENLLAQLAGNKTFLLIDPSQNERIYEGHIREAKLRYDRATASFHRSPPPGRTSAYSPTGLQDSTSMVMSPVNISAPDLKSYPKFEGVRHMECTVGPGEVLYVPAFWWHEVQSTPEPLANGETNGQAIKDATFANIALNAWYSPMLSKAFPCPECRLDLNQEYHSTVEELFRASGHHDSET